MKSGKVNQYGTHKNLGYNLKVMDKAFNYAMM